MELSLITVVNRCCNQDDDDDDDDLSSDIKLAPNATITTIQNNRSVQHQRWQQKIEKTSSITNWSLFRVPQHYNCITTLSTVFLLLIALINPSESIPCNIARTKCAYR